MKEMIGYKCEICGNIFTEEEYGNKKTAEKYCKKCEQDHEKVKSHKIIYERGCEYPSFVDITFENGISFRYSADF